MDAPEAEAAYLTVRSQLDAGQIPLDEYNRMVGELRYQDNTGTWWAVSPIDGSWLRWNGTVWEPAFAQQVPAVQTRAPAAPVATPAPQAADQVAAQPVTPIWYIPPVSGGKAPATATPVSVPVQTTAPQAQVVRQPSSKGKKFAVGSIACGIAAFILLPYVLGIIGIILGVLSLKEKYRPGAIGIAIGAAVILIAFLLTSYPELLS